MTLTLTLTLILILMLVFYGARWKPRLDDDAARGVVRAYQAGVSFTDHNVGRILDALRADEELWASTVVLLWGDHGWKLGHHGAWAKVCGWVGGRTDDGRTDGCVQCARCSNQPWTKKEKKGRIRCIRNEYLPPCSSSLSVETSLCRPLQTILVPLPFVHSN